MEQVIDKVAAWITQMVVSGILLTPVLLILKLVSPIPLPWITVVIPLLGICHLLLCWCAGRIIATIVLDLLQTKHRP